ncbi:hypothetical protein H4218_000830 [Coemansia sp. IMI 209128]|nr:hypothetical protein H4218_000830 [Coemansia sp. IMI 209128]
MGQPTHIINNAYLRNYVEVQDDADEEGRNFGQMAIMATHEGIVATVYHFLMSRLSVKLECYYEIIDACNSKEDMPMLDSDGKPNVWITWDSSLIDAEVCDQLEGAVDEHNNFSEREVFFSTFDI